MTNRTTHVEPVVMTFRLSPDVMEQALPYIQQLSALQSLGDDPHRTADRPPADHAAPTYGEERMSKAEARAMLPKAHEGLMSAVVDEDEKRTTRRGRIPGLYKLVDNAVVDVEQLTPSALAIYRVMQARVRKAATSQDIAQRLRMSNGTVGWALAELRKMGLVEYLPRAGGKAASRQAKGTAH